MSASMNEVDYIRRTKLARETAGLVQEEVAEHLGVSRSAYGNYERPDGNPLRPMNRKHIPAFCEITKVSERWLISGKGAMREDQGMDEMFEQIESMWTGFNEDLKRQIFETIKQADGFQKQMDKMYDSKQPHPDIEIDDDAGDIY